MNLKEAVLLPFSDNCSQMFVLETRSGTACDWVRRKAERKCCDGGLSLGLRQRAGGGDCRNSGGDGAGEDERIDGTSCRHMGFFILGLWLHPRGGALAHSRYRPEYYSVVRSLIREQRVDPRAP
jgi:hypothetical protein